MLNVGLHMVKSLIESNICGKGQIPLKRQGQICHPNDNIISYMSNYICQFTYTRSHKPFPIFFFFHITPYSSTNNPPIYLPYVRAITIECPSALEVFKKEKLPRIHIIFILFYQ